MAQPEVQCRVCGAPGGAPCVHLRTGKPIKNFHHMGRVYVVQAHRVDVLTNRPTSRIAKP